MDLLALEYFVEVSQAGGFSTASAIIKVSQPTLSRHIKQLEDELGTRLFQRGVGGQRRDRSHARLGRRFG